MEEIVRLCRPDIYAMRPYSSARIEGADRPASIYLDANESPYPPYPGGDAQLGLNRYPQPQPEPLVGRFAQLFHAPRESIFVSRGADEAIDLLVRAFCEAGRDAIMVTPPTFVMYETAANIQGAAVCRVPLLQSDTFGLDVDAMLDAHTNNPAIKLVFVCSPNNPTANLMRRDDVLRLAEQLLGRALVVVDELYVDYSGSPSLGAEVATHPNLVVIRSLSKEYSLAGERCGIAIAHSGVIGILRRVMPPYPLAASSIRIIADAMAPDGIDYARDNIRRVLDERNRVESVLTSSAAVTRIFPSDANFLLLQTPNPKLLVELMALRGIKVRDRSQAIDNAVRLSIGTPAENDAALAVFADYATQL